VADDHVTLRAAPDGRLFLVAKDDIGDGRLHLYIRSVGGAWGHKTLVNPDPTAQPTRQAVVLDLHNNHAYVMYRNSLDDNRIIASLMRMSDGGFAGLCVAIESPAGSRALSNVTSTKQNVDGATDVVAAASRSGEIFSSIIDVE
jgi:hypothetical protein